MAGHSKFKNIMHRKGAQDKKRAKIFSRLGREISVSVKEGGPDPEKNIRLRSAIGSAKSLNMPKDNIERAIKKGEGNDADSNYEEVRYEGYGPDGVAIIVEALTNNKNVNTKIVSLKFITRKRINMPIINEDSFKKIIICCKVVIISCTSLNIDL